MGRDGLEEAAPPYTITKVGWEYWRAIDRNGKPVGFVVATDSGPDRYEVGYPLGEGPSTWHPTVGVAKTALSERLDATLGTS